MSIHICTRALTAHRNEHIYMHTIQTSAYHAELQSQTGLTKFTQLHVVTSSFVMFIPCALRARIEGGTGSRLEVLDRCEVYSLL